MPTVAASIAVRKMRLRGQIAETFLEPERFKLLKAYDLLDQGASVAPAVCTGSMLGLLPGLLLHFSLFGEESVTLISLTAYFALVGLYCSFGAVIAYYLASGPSKRAIARLRAMVESDPELPRRLRWLAEQDGTLASTVNRVLA